MRRSASASSVLAQAEDPFHIQVAGYLGWVLPPPIMWTTFPAGGGGLRRGIALKRKGLKAGISDILVWRPIEPSPAIYMIGLELKTDIGPLKPSQRKMLPLLLASGFAGIFICRSLDDVKEALTASSFQTREAKPSTELIRAGFSVAASATQ